MNNKTKTYLFEQTANLKAQKKEFENRSEYDPVRSEIERRYQHNLSQIIMNGLLTVYEEYQQKGGIE